MLPSDALQTTLVLDAKLFYRIGNSLKRQGPRQRFRCRGPGRCQI